MRIFGHLHGPTELMAEIEVVSEKAEFIDNTGNELWQPKSIRRTITGNIARSTPLWNEYVEFWQTMNDDRFQINGIDYFNAGVLQIDFDRYAAGGSISLNVTNNVVTILALEEPLVIEETVFSEVRYFERVTERNSGKRNKVATLIERLKRQKSGLTADVTKNDVRELLGYLREADFEIIIPREQCDGMIETLDSLLDEVNALS
jgi:hypothetical protein